MAKTLSTEELARSSLERRAVGMPTRAGFRVEVLSSFYRTEKALLD